MPAIPTEFVLWFFTIVVGLELLALASVPSVLVQRAGRPMAALSWILALLTVPPIGLVLWWLLGRSHLRKQRKRRRAATNTIATRIRGLVGEPDAAPERSTLAHLPLFKLPEDIRESVFPAVCGNHIDLLVDATNAYPKMLEAIRNAEHHIHLLFYIWNDDATGKEFLDALVDKARQGVEVRLLCDGMGSPAVGTSFTKPLEDAGGQVARFLPPRLLVPSPTINFRNHRKIIVVDAKVGFTGGINIGDEYRGAWHDLAVRIHGPAVDQLQQVFADDWYFVTDHALVAPEYFSCIAGEETDMDVACSVVASGPDAMHNAMHDALFIAMNEARRRLFIITPYFIPSLPILASLRAAVYRGVDVRVMVPAHSDLPIVRMASRSFYPGLLYGGVRLFEYQRAMLHAKAVIFDDDLVLIGSANMDNRSFKLNFEASCFLDGREINEDLERVFNEDLSACREVGLEEVENRPWRAQVIDAAAHLLSPFL